VKKKSFLFQKSTQKEGEKTSGQTPIVSNPDNKLKKINLKKGVIDEEI